MNTPPLTDPRMLPGLAGFFARTLDIQASTPTPDAYGGTVASWAAVTGLTGLSATIAPARRPRSREIQKPLLTEDINTFLIVLQGYYPAITPAMRAVVGTTIYDILTVDTDSQNRLTQLIARVVTI